MKKTEAISIFATSVRPREPKDRARYDEAVRMAIEALKCSETPNSSERTAETAQADHIAESGRKVEQTAEIAQNVQNGDLIQRKTAIEAIRECAEVAHDNREWGMEQGYLNAIECVEEEPSAQPEIIRCKDCKYMIDTGDDLMCDNAKGWVVATASDFGCVLAERRTE